MVDQETFARIGEMFVEKYGGNSTEAAKFLMGTSDKLGGKSPFISNIGPGSFASIKRGDSESDLLAKMYVSMLREYDLAKKQFKEELNYQKQIVGIKERRIAELIESLGSEYTPEGKVKKKPRKGLGMIALGIAGLLYSPDVMAMFSGVGDTFDNILDKINNLGSDLKLFETVQPTITGAGPSAPTPYDELFETIGKQEGVDPALLKSIAKVESGFRPGVTSPKKAKGLMQLMPDTAKQYGVPAGKEYDPAENIRGGAKFLKHLIDKYNGDLQLVAAAYNAGEGNVKKYGGQIPPFKETKEYVAKVMGELQQPSVAMPTETDDGALELQTITSKSGASTQVNKKYATNFQGFINDLEGTGYKVKSLSGYNDRPNVNNPKVKSYHALGASIDINPTENPNESMKSDLPPETGGLARKWGLGWGMNWKSVKDPMHFSVAKSEGGAVDIQRPPASMKMKVTQTNRTTPIPQSVPNISAGGTPTISTINNNLFVDDSMIYSIINDIVDTPPIFGQR